MNLGNSWGIERVNRCWWTTAFSSLGPLGMYSNTFKYILGTKGDKDDMLINCTEQLHVIDPRSHAHVRSSVNIFVMPLPFSLFDYHRERDKTKKPQY
ncbi:hypothetical protein SAMN04487897_101111 [Paenibacillus sp. yr247]|nr:hypothetical protein SAMN04487897_101111 [Paenibacillus sp. yr247]